MKKRNNRLWESCTRELGLETKLEKRWFIAGFILLFVYLWLCQYLHNYLVLDTTPGIVSALLLPAMQALPLCAFGVILFGKAQITAVSSGDGTSWFRRFFPAIAALLIFGYLLLWLIAYFPGGFSLDSVRQFQQVLTGDYNNWHPVIHTWIFFWIPWQIFHHLAGIIFFQILLFSLAVAICTASCAAGAAPCRF